MDDIILRDGLPSDRNFIFKTILQHYRHASPHNKDIPDNIYYDCHHLLISKVMRQPGNIVRVAALKEDPEVLFGFLWGNIDPETVHYVYVKKAFRRMGMARMMYESLFDDDADVYITHWTREAAFLYEKNDNLVFNPYLLHGDIWKLLQSGGEGAPRDNN